MRPLSSLPYRQAGIIRYPVSFFSRTVSPSSDLPGRNLHYRMYIHRIYAEGLKNNSTTFALSAKWLKG